MTTGTKAMVAKLLVSGSALTANAVIPTERQSSLWAIRCMPYSARGGKTSAQGSGRFMRYRAVLIWYGMYR